MTPAGGALHNQRLIRKGGYVASSIEGLTLSESEKYERSLQLAKAAAKSAAENRGTDIAVLDMRKQSQIFDYFVIVTGTSRRQLHAISEDIDHVLEDELQDKRMGIEGYNESRWILLDYGNVVIHIFDDETRAVYGLEQLWADATPVDISDVLQGIELHRAQ